MSGNIGCCTGLTTRGDHNKPKKKNNIPEKILLFCILFLSYRWIFEDDRFTFAVAGLGYMALTGWVFRFGGRADQDISSESVDENPLYVYGMMRKNTKMVFRNQRLFPVSNVAFDRCFFCSSIFLLEMLDE